MKKKKIAFYQISALFTVKIPEDSTQKCILTDFMLLIFFNP